MPNPNPINPNPKGSGKWTLGIHFTANQEIRDALDRIIVKSGKSQNQTLRDLITDADKKANK